MRRTTDGHLIHANIDTEIIITEECLLAALKTQKKFVRELSAVPNVVCSHGHHLSCFCKLVSAQSSCVPDHESQNIMHHDLDLCLALPSNSVGVNFRDIF